MRHEANQAFTTKTVLTPLPLSFRAHLKSAICYSLLPEDESKNHSPQDRKAKRADSNPNLQKHTTRRHPKAPKQSHSNTSQKPSSSTESPNGSKPSNSRRNRMQPDRFGQLRKAKQDSDHLLQRHKSSFDDATQCLQAAKELSQAANELLKQMDPDFSVKPPSPPRVYNTHPSEMNYLHQLAKEQYELTRKRFEANCGTSFGSGGSGSGSAQK